MEDTAQYEQLTKEELIQVIVDLKKEIEACHHRERHPHPDAIVMVQASHCADCGASLSGREGSIGQIA